MAHARIELRREEWMQHGNCRDADTDLFFGDRPGTGNILDWRAAKAICAGCVVRVSCLDYAMRQGERHGVWGGLSEKERRSMRRDQAS